MRNYHRIIAKRMAGKARVIHGNMIGNISPDMEWIKWLSYEPEFVRKRIEYFDSKKVSELSYDELEEASCYSRDKLFARLFRIYGTKECSEEDYMRVYDYMSSESIEKLMLRKLSSEELQYAKQEITRLSEIPKEQLKAKIEEQTKETYENLSMVESFILHMISKINYARSISDLHREIDAQVQQNEAMAHKSLYYATTPCA